jgi:HPt (histidine-containing phosphotransfer) domain-containing protein
MEAALLQLDAHGADAETINTVFRAAHSIKGGAGMFGFSDIASFTHTLETLLDELRSGRMRLTPHACSRSPARGTPLPGRSGPRAERGWMTRAPAGRWGARAGVESCPAVSLRHSVGVP